MDAIVLRTARLVLRPLPATAAAALLKNRQDASRILAAALSPDWPDADLIDARPMQAAASKSGERGDSDQL